MGGRAHDRLGAPLTRQVVGVGGGGSNAVNRMIAAELQGIEFWVLNTDAQVWAGEPLLFRMRSRRWAWARD